MSIAELAEMWRSHGRCDAIPVEWDYPSGAMGLPTVHARRWDGCSGSGPVRMDVIDGMGHWWPKADDNPSGLDASEVIADYFFPLTP